MSLNEQVPVGMESQFQRAAEQWLAYRGYLPSTPRTLQAGRPKRGWQYHWPRCQGNPLILDLLLLGLDGRWLQIELKTSVGRLSKHQACIVDQAGPCAAVCRSLDEVIRVVTNWENSK